MNEEQITLSAHSFVYDPATFLEPLDSDNPAILAVPYSPSEELINFGIRCNARRVMEPFIDEEGNPDWRFRYNLEIWVAKACSNCDESPDIDYVHPGDKIAILGYENYTIIRKEDIESTN
ncbi:MAG: hypothetical protein H9W81_09875 [Enterococcus sp.]|nr:hypothetical protein [Enterococcus sp.]